MPTRDIKCANCGLKGKLGVSGLRGDVPMPELFRHLGHNPFSGYMQFRCPACKEIVDVNPMEALGDGVITGLKHKIVNPFDIASFWPYESGPAL